MRELLLKYIEGDCTDQEKIEITNWLDSSPDNIREYLALRRLNDITIWQTATDVKQSQKTKLKNLSWTRTRFIKEALKIAAVFIFAVLISRYIIPNQDSVATMQTLFVPAGQRAELTLEDGTKVWLNAKTTLTFPNQFSDNSREVKLDGEGYFDVSSDKSKPFIVNTEEYNVKVWGTEFNLMAYSENENFETSLFEGSVEVLAQGLDEGVMLKPNERIYLNDGKMIIEPINDMDHFLWKEGILSFDDATFPELVSKLELYFDLKIEVETSQVLGYRCTGKFRMKDGVEQVLKVLQLKHEFSYEIDNKLNMITIRE